MSKAKKTAAVSQEVHDFIPVPYQKLHRSESQTWENEVKTLGDDLNRKEIKLLKTIPSNINPIDVLRLVNDNVINSVYIKSIKELTNFSDEIISTWLNTSVKTYRSYKNTTLDLDTDKQERTIRLLALIRHGLEVFGTKEAFSEWLSKKNFHFDFKPPVEFLKSISGIIFVNDRLTALEYGDNA